MQLGRKIALHHWRQLGSLLAVQPPAPQTVAPAPEVIKVEPQADFEMIAVPAGKVDMAIAILKAAGVL